MEYKPVDFGQMEGHTVGPWRLTQKYTPESDYGHWYHIIDAGTGYSDDGFCLPGIVGPQDAHLLAAAPDMKAEILHLRAQVETILDALTQITAFAKQKLDDQSRAEEMAVFKMAYSAIKQVEV